MTTTDKNKTAAVVVIIGLAFAVAGCQTTTAGSDGGAPVVDQVALLKKKQDDAKQQVAAIMAAAAAMADRGDLRGAIVKYQTALAPAAFSEVPGLKGNVLNEISLLTGKLAVPPAVPEAARHAGIRGETLLQGAKDTTTYKRAALEFGTAIDAAPWWSSAYYNLALALEGAENAAGAIRTYKWFLNAEPNAKEAPAIRDRIVRLEVVAEEQARKAAWNGYWKSSSGSVLRTELKNGVVTFYEFKTSAAAKKNGYYDGQVIFSGTLNGEVATGKEAFPHCFEGAHWACKRCFPGFQQKDATARIRGRDELVISYEGSFMENFNINTCAITSTTRMKGKLIYPRDKEAERAHAGS